MTYMAFHYYRYQYPCLSNFCITINLFIDKLWNQNIYTNNKSEINILWRNLYIFHYIHRQVKLPSLLLLLCATWITCNIIPPNITLPSFMQPTYIYKQRKAFVERFKIPSYNTELFDENDFGHAILIARYSIFFTSTILWLVHMEIIA